MQSNGEFDQEKKTSVNIDHKGKRGEPLGQSLEIKISNRAHLIYPNGSIWYNIG